MIEKDPMIVNRTIIGVLSIFTKPLLFQSAMKPLQHIIPILLLLIFVSTHFHCPSFASYDGPLYDSSAYSECRGYPERALYNGGILRDQTPHYENVIDDHGRLSYSPVFLLNNLNHSTFYCFSIWVKLEVQSSDVVICARLITENSTTTCVGNVIARHGCWSFLKGGFLLNLPSNSSRLYFRSNQGNETKIKTAEASLQQFTREQWKINQDVNINKRRKRAVSIHVSDQYGDTLRGASVEVEQISKDFLFGSAIADTIIGNDPYQKWFNKRFNAAVFENELKWYATEPKPMQLNYTTADKMLQFVRSNQISTRGHNIFWEDPRYTPSWVRNLTNAELKLAVESRIRSLLERYKDDFIHWDVNNEMLHFNFFEERLGSNASLELFKVAHEIDPLATLFMNDFNVVETCDDVNSSVDSYILRIKELRKSGVWMDGVGLEGHFTVPNLPFMRATIDKFATLGIPIWLTEVDISKSLGMEAQAFYLEQVLREGFGHPAVDGIMLWSALHDQGCYQMCLTDNEFRNLPAGDVVDKLLKEWQTGLVEGLTNERGSYSFYGFLGEYRITARHGGRSINSTFSLSPSDETKHVNIQI